MRNVSDKMAWSLIFAEHQPLAEEELPGCGLWREPVWSAESRRGVGREANLDVQQRGVSAAGEGAHSCFFQGQCSIKTVPVHREINKHSSLLSL